MEDIERWVLWQCTRRWTRQTRGSHTKSLWMPWKFRQSVYLCTNNVYFMITLVVTSSFWSRHVQTNHFLHSSSNSLMLYSFTSPHFSSLSLPYSCTFALLTRLYLISLHIPSRPVPSHQVIGGISKGLSTVHEELDKQKGGVECNSWKVFAFVTHETKTISYFCIGSLSFGIETWLE